MKDLTIILPIHEITDKNLPFIKNSVESVRNLEGADDIVLMVVGPEKVIDKIHELELLHDINQHSYVVNRGETDFSSQINYAVEKYVKTTWFSVLELDDIYRPTWFSNVEKYIETKPEVTAFLPLTEMYGADNNFLGYINEVVMASSFSNELGYLDLECLEIYFDFNVTGGVIKRDAFLSIGGLKPSIKISFWYEFLMRMCYNNMKIMVIPKVGYFHTIGREESLMRINQENITPEEGSWWIKLAQQEYFFKNDRNKTYPGPQEIISEK